MKLIKQYLLLILVCCLAAPVMANAQVGDSNVLESMNVVQQGGTLSVRLTFKAPLPGIPAGFRIAQPARIALDFPNTTNGLGKNSQIYNEGALQSANIVQAEGRTRLVFNLTAAMSYETKIEGNSLLLSLAPIALPDSGLQETASFAKAPVFSAMPNSIRDIGFRRGKNGEARIVVDLSSPDTGIDIRQQGTNLVVDFVKVNVPDALRKRLDVADFATPVTSLNTVQQGANARLTITPHGLWEHNAYQTDNQFVIEVVQVVENQNKLVQGSRGGYQGEKLSLNFQNVDVRRLLQVVGEFTGMNMVVSDSVQGAITLILKDVPWDQALDIIMKQKDLDMRKNGNVILIAPREELATKEKLELEAKSQIGELEPTRTESFQLNYQKADAVQKLLTDEKQKMLTKRGTAVADSRSNILFVQDTPTSLESVKTLIAKIDQPVRQVLIEARIVEATDNFSKNLGVRLGANQVGAGHAINAGGQTGPGGQFMLGSTLSSSSYQAGLINGSAPPFIPDGQNVNLPAANIGGKSAGAMSLILFNSARTLFLNTEISALEADGLGKVISSPRVMTANQVEAIIEQGIEIPYVTISSTGASTTSFRKANLSLKVKPQITPDGKITMSLDINNDAISTSARIPAGIVGIDTKHIKTEVLVDNGGTVVIGGIYVQNKMETTTRIPFFGDLPYVGFLFKNNEKFDNKTEMLIFITPKIVSEALSIR